jgi:hypothetical protein
VRRFKEYLIESQYMYHGSPHKDIKQFKPDRSEYMIDRAIGTHFAADPKVAHKFATGVAYRGLDKEGKGDGHVYKTRAPKRSELQVIHQKNYSHIDKDTGKRVIHGKTSDQYAVGAHVTGTVFSHPEHKELFKSWVKHARNVDEPTAEKIHAHLSAGKAPHGPEFGVAAHKGKTFRSYMHNFDSNLSQEPHKGFREKVVHHYLDIQRKRGIKGLVYHNTSPEETKGDVRSKKSYILFHPEEHPHPIE